MKPEGRLLAMFPLGSVLFPHAYLPLHVFEPRYQALTEACLAGGREFGVVLIERGSEVGGGDHRFGLGTVARITEAARAPDGRWALATVGTRRARVTRWLPDDPYPQALVDDVVDEAPVVDDSGLLAAAELEVRRALALKTELDEPAAPVATPVDADPEVAAWQLAAMAPLGPLDRQRLLEATGRAERLRLLAGLVAEEAAVLAYRLGAG